jgi:sortase A
MALGYRSRLVVARFGRGQVAATAPASRATRASTSAAPTTAPDAARHDLPLQVLRTTRAKPLRWFAAAAAIVACGYLGHAAYLHAKARLAQHLIASAWDETRASGKPTRPWPWADVHPVARLVVPRLGTSMVVLEGDSGRSLAFAPGHRTGTPLPGANGNAVISAHRDTHFTFLRHVRTGDRIVVETAAGSSRAYRVTTAEVAHESRLDLLADRREAELTLVTCWPFDAVAPNGPLRYVVKAIAETGVPAAPATGPGADRPGVPTRRGAASATI